MSDFTGDQYDFAPGSLKGLRGWNMDSLGRLHGVTHEEVWLPGENVSICKQEATVPCPAINRREEARKASEAGRAKVESKKKKRNRNSVEYTLTFNTEGFCPRTPCGDPTCVRGEHHVVTSGHRFDPNCKCGFWAYDEAGFVAHGSVVGVIEGYGKTTVGTKGFRSEKARIIALSCEDSKGERHSRSVLARLAELYPEVAFAETVAGLIDDHPEVLRTWPQVDEGFWLKPVTPKRSEYSMGGVTWSSIASAMSLSPSSWRISGGI